MIPHGLLSYVVLSACEAVSLSLYPLPHAFLQCLSNISLFSLPLQLSQQVPYLGSKDLVIPMRSLTQQVQLHPAYQWPPQIRVQIPIPPPQYPNQPYIGELIPAMFIISSRDTACSTSTPRTDRPVAYRSGIDQATNIASRCQGRTHCCFPRSEFHPRLCSIRSP